MRDPLARVSWDTALAEREDVIRRLFASGCVAVERLTWARWLRVVPLAIGMGLAFPLLRWLDPSSHWGLTLASIGLAGALLFVVLGRPWARAWQLRRWQQTSQRRLIRRWGTGPVPFTVELHADGLVGVGPGMHQHLAWREVLAVERDGADLVVLAPGQIVMLRGRAFADAAAAEVFYAQVERLWSAARDAVG